MKAQMGAVQLYQSDSPYVFDSTKFSKACRAEPTSYEEGIRRMKAATFKEHELAG